PEPPTLFDNFAGRCGAAKLASMSLTDLLPRHFHLTRPRRMNDQQFESWNAVYGPKNKLFEQSNLKGKDLIRWRYQRYIKDYLRTVAAIDDNIGRLLDYLDRTGLAKNTIVIYSSDQGYYLGEHGWVDKRWMYEPSLRTPLLVRWPGVSKPGTVDYHLVQNLDIAPTLLSAAQVAIPADLQGRSLKPLLAGDNSVPWRDAIYYHFYESDGWGNVPAHYGVRTDQHKLIHFYEINEWEMFDLEKDPRELQSVYEDEAYGIIRQQLETKLKDLRNQYQIVNDKS
ncbi:MAG: DUF4976 domain-containing protein, partial [Gimesia sp.]